jgi:hypothetical protein
MAIPARLSRRLRESLGEEGADDLMNWMVTLEERRSELQDVVEAWKATTDSRFDAFEGRVDARFGAFEARVDLRFSEQQRLMESGFAALETRFERRFGDLIKWSFVFWCGAIAAVSMLAR